MQDFPANELNTAPEAPSIGQLYTYTDKLTNGATRPVVMVFTDTYHTKLNPKSGEKWRESSGWLVSQTQDIRINGVYIPFTHYRDAVFNSEREWPKHDVMCYIEQAVLKYTWPGEALIAHVADYNYAPFLIFHGADGTACKIRLEDSDVAPLGRP